MSSSNFQYLEEITAIFDSPFLGVHFKLIFFVFTDKRVFLKINFI